ncbi:DUF2637 domain-containing protein [Streptomyces nigrescens]
MTPPAHGSSPVGSWDRIAILLLGAAGCALSYDALQQMAVAIHVRGWLTYLYPLVIDGFIAYGVRALILTSTAPLRARFYVWALFSAATAASIWANALHAVRLNQAATASGMGLRLGDVTVGILSTLAPLALAGAVHLYILITRHLTTTNSGTGHGPVTELRTTPRVDRRTDHSDRAAATDRTSTGPRTDTADRIMTADRQVAADQVRGPVSALPTARTGPDGGPYAHPADHSIARSLTGTDSGAAHRDVPLYAHPADRTAGSAAQKVASAGREERTATDHGPETNDADQRSVDRTVDADQRTNTADQQRSAPGSGPVGGPPSAAADRSADRERTGPPEAGEIEIESLLPIARAAVRRENRISRTVVRSALREHEISASNQRMSLLLQQLKTEATPTR